MMRSFSRQLLVFATLLCAAPLGCGYNEVVDRDEDVKAAWAEVNNQYKRRADLIPNLVKVVKGAADFEQNTLQKVIEARSRVASFDLGGVIDDPEKLKKFEQAQNQLSGAVSRLLVVAERYPELSATESFRDLQAQIEGTENRITVARRRFIEAVATYNKVVLRFPSSIGAGLRGMDVRPTFETPEGLANPPEVAL